MLVQNNFENQNQRDISVVDRVTSITKPFILLEADIQGGKQARQRTMISCDGHANQFAKDAVEEIFEYSWSTMLTRTGKTMYYLISFGSVGTVTSWCTGTTKHSSDNGGCSSMVEHLVVVQAVVGSNPITHPTKNRPIGSVFRLKKTAPMRHRGCGDRVGALAETELPSSRKTPQVSSISLQPSRG